MTGVVSAFVVAWVMMGMLGYGRLVGALLVRIGPPPFTFVVSLVGLLPLVALAGPLAYLAAERVVVEVRVIDAQSDEESERE